MHNLDVFHVFYVQSYTNGMAAELVLSILGSQMIGEITLIDCIVQEK